MTGELFMPGSGSANVVAVGLDVVEISRIARALERRPGLHERLFTDAERTWCERVHDPMQRYAVRFAAKEAAMKALGVGISSGYWQDIAVAVGASGEPSLEVTGRAAARARDRGGARWLVSLTHTGDIAQAIVLLCAP